MQPRDPTGSPEHTKRQALLKRTMTGPITSALVTGNAASGANAPANLDPNRASGALMIKPPATTTNASFKTMRVVLCLCGSSTRLFFAGTIGAVSMLPHPFGGSGTAVPFALPTHAQNGHAGAACVSMHPAPVRRHGCALCASDTRAKRARRGRLCRCTPHPFGGTAVPFALPSLHSTATFHGDFQANATLSPHPRNPDRCPPECPWQCV